MMTLLVEHLLHFIPFSMDHFFLHLCIFSASLSLMFAFLISWKKPQKNNLPPGKTGWPIMGEMWDFVTAFRRGTPHKFVKDRMAKYSSNVFKTRLFGEKMAVLCGPAGNKFLFSNGNKYVISWWPPSASKVFGTSPDRQVPSEVRSRALEFFKLEFLRKYVVIMDSLAKQHVETYWSPGEQVKVHQLSKMYTFTLACKLLLNVKDEALIKRLEDLFVVLLTGIISIPVNFPGTEFHRAIKAAKIIREEIVEIIKKRKKELKENDAGESQSQTTAIDLLTRLLQQEGDEDLNETHIAGVVMGLLIGSYDTTSTTVTFIIHYLEKYPHVYQMLFQEQMEIYNSKSPGELLNWDDLQKMKYSWWVACEAMRLVPPSPGSFREVIVECQFAGFTIPKGWKIHWMPESTHADPNYFPNPEKFDPLRFEGSGPPPFCFVAFGGGPRMCPGREFARLSILVFLHNVVTKFKFKRVNPHQKIICSPNPTPVDGLLMQLLPI